MSSTRAIQFLHSCTGALTTKHLSRSAVNFPRRHVIASRRYYSEEAKPPEEQKEEQKEDTQGSGDADSDLAAQLKKKEDQVVDVMSRLRYLQADFLNLQRNAAREKEQTRDFAISRFASDLLETVDVLSLALKSVPESTVSSSAPTPSSSDSPPPSPSNSTTPKTAETHLRELYTGVEMTHRLLLQTLFKYNVTPFDPIGDKFDPNKHEALYQAPVPDKEPGTVIDCQTTGYMIKDRVLRAARVGVVQDALNDDQ